jgi:uncharacterized protein YjbJ (UPF0337 family)
MSATTLVLDGGDNARRTSFEVRLARAVLGTRKSDITSEEVRNMSIEEQAKGKLDETKGRTKQAQGDLTGDNSKKAEGVADEAKGKARQAAERVREAAHDLTR